MNADHYLTMLVITKHYHVSSGHCASAHLLKDGCMGTFTTHEHVHGHVRAAHYNSARRAVAACHKYGETFDYWMNQYFKALGHTLPATALHHRIEEARRARYEEVAA